MEKMLLEIDDVNCELHMLDGSKWTIEPFDFSICCTWVPTSMLTIRKNKEKGYYTICKNGVCVRAMKPY